MFDQRKRFNPLASPLPITLGFKPRVLFFIGIYAKWFSES